MSPETLDLVEEMQKDMHAFIETMMPKLKERDGGVYMDLQIIWILHKFAEMQIKIDDINKTLKYNYMK